MLLFGSSGITIALGVVAAVCYLSLGVATLAAYSIKKERLNNGDAWGMMLGWPVVAVYHLVCSGVIQFALHAPERLSRHMFQKSRPNVDHAKLEQERREKKARLDY